MECRYCGSDQVEYIGAVDGGGDYGEAICDEWQCHHCDNRFDGDCIGEAYFYDINGMDETEALNTARLDSSNDDFGDIPF